MDGIKSQDLGLLLKLVSLRKQETTEGVVDTSAYTVRNLELETGIGKSQVSNSLRRCFDVGLAKKDRNSGIPRVNTKRLFEFINYGAKYVFPAKPGQLVRGIGTAFAAPVLENRVFSAGELLPVWPDAQGKNKGLEVAPLFKTVGHAVRRDPELYALLALVDAIRIGSPREANLAKDLLKKHMEVSE
jgi:hypothetical protein